MQKIIKEKIGGLVEVIEAPIIDICGEGSSTGKLIEITEKIVKEAKIIYQNIWVVFDKDDFEDFDQAIKEGMDKGYKIAWRISMIQFTDATRKKSLRNTSRMGVLLRVLLLNMAYPKPQFPIGCAHIVKNAKQMMKPNLN
mgnify:FL=1